MLTSLGRRFARVYKGGAAATPAPVLAKAAVLPRFGVDRYVDSVAALYDRLLAQEGA